MCGCARHMSAGFYASGASPLCALSRSHVPPAQVSYALSPVQIIVAEKGRAWYHFLTTTCAVVGGVFTVAGICDGLLHTSVRAACVTWI